jgi:Domain of Unknown Function (DUF1206)
MPSIAAARASGTARRASDSPAARALARMGLTARGVLYVLIGWIAVLVALGRSSHEADQVGALQLLAGQLKSLARAAIHAFFGYQTFRIISGAGAGSQAAKQDDLTASMMRHAGGRWVVGVVGIIIVIVGPALILEGVRRKFLKYLQLSNPEPPDARDRGVARRDRDGRSRRGVRARGSAGRRRGRDL